MRWLLVLALGCDHAATAPHVTRATPDYGPLSGGTRITLEGDGFASRVDRVLLAAMGSPDRAELQRRIAAATARAVVQRNPRVLADLRQM